MAVTTIWKRTAIDLPPEGQVVVTMSALGLEQKLKRSGSLWFFPDGSMYVYYEVRYWRELDEDGD
jgi:hypothetical protein